MIRFTLKGNFKKSQKFFQSIEGQELERAWEPIFERYAQIGLRALQASTPINSGETAQKWNYRINKRGITFTNDNISDGIPVVVLIQYGHATGNGGYVPPHDFINPALRPIFNKIAEECWKEVTAL